MSQMFELFQTPNLGQSQFFEALRMLNSLPPDRLVEVLRDMEYDRIDPRLREVIQRRLPSTPVDVTPNQRSVNPFSPELTFNVLRNLAQNMTRGAQPGRMPQPPFPEEEAANLPPLEPPALPLPPPPRPQPATAARAPAVTPASGDPAPTPTPDAPAAAKKPAFGNSNFFDRLAALGFAMAASRNPSLFGMIGEGGLQMQRHEREQRELAAREQQVAEQADYNRARIDLARAELDWSRDPTNPANILRLVQARAAMARSDRGEQDPITSRAVDRQGNLVGVTRSGRVVPLRDPDGNPLPAPNEASQEARALDAMRRQYIMQRVRELTAVPAGIPGARPQADGQTALRQAIQEANQIFPALPSAFGMIRNRNEEGEYPITVPSPPVRPNIPVYDPVRGRLVDR